MRKLFVFLTLMFVFWGRNLLYSKEVKTLNYRFQIPKQLKIMRYKGQIVIFDQIKQSNISLIAKELFSKKAIEAFIKKLNSRLNFKLKSQELLKNMEGIRGIFYQKGLKAKSKKRAEPVLLRLIIIKHPEKKGAGYLLLLGFCLADDLKSRFILKEIYQTVH